MNQPYLSPRALTDDTIKRQIRMYRERLAAQSNPNELRETDKVLRMYLSEARRRANNLP